jgi:4-amino-4-deoxy-L-arabinose transferase-like glycosyltransferase
VTPGTRVRRLRPRIETIPGRLGVDHLLLTVIVAAWIGLYLEGLGELPIRVWDESRYATPASHMAEGGSWLDPKIRVNTHAEGLELGPRLTKPPLVYWLQAAAMSVLGVTEFAARLPTALASLGCAGIVYRLGSRTYDRRAGFAGALALLAFPGLLLGSHGGRAAVSDTTLAFFGSAFVWLTWRGRERPRLLVPAGAFAGLAVMTKGVAAGVFVVILAPVVVYRYRSYLTAWTGAAVATTVVVALPWHLYAWMTYGEAFVDQYFLRSVASRVTGELSGPGVEPVFGFMNYPYFRYAARIFAPPYPYALPVFGTGLVCALVVLVRSVRRDGARQHREKLLLVWWAAAVPLTFAVAGGNHAWYLLPMYVPGATLLGYVPAAIADGRLGAGLRGRAGSAGDGAGLLPAVGSDWSPSGRRAAYIAVCVGIVVLLAATYGAPLAEAYNEEQRDIGTRIATEVPAEETVYVSREGVSRRSLMTVSFYADRTLERAETGRLMTDDGVSYAVLPIGAVDRIDRPHAVLARGPENGIAVVAFATG